MSAAGTDGPAGFAVGLCTVTFRSLDPAAVVDRAVGAGVEVLEWGGDVHVPEGDLDAARWAAHLSAAAGLGVAAYGSYLYLDEHLDRRLGPVLDTTVALGAPAVRVWCPDLTDEGAGWSALVPLGEPNGVRRGPGVPIGRFHRLPDRSRRPEPTGS